MLKIKTLLYLSTAVVILVVLSWYYTGAFRMGAFYNADALYVPDLVTDLQHSIQTLFSWNLSRAPSFIDVAIFYVINIFFSVFNSLAVFFVLQIVLTVFLAYLIYREQFDEYQAVVFASLATMVFSVLVLTQAHPYFLILKSAHHYLTFLAWGFATLYFVNYLAGKQKGQWWFFILLFVQCLSDQLFIIHFVLPCLLMCAYHGYQASTEKRKQMVQFGLKVVVVVFSTVLIFYAFQNSDLQSAGRVFDFQHIDFLKLFKFWMFFYGKYPVLSSMTVIFYVVVLIKTLSKNQNNVVLNFLLLSFFITVAVLTVSDKNILGRYLLPYLFSPVLLVFYLLPVGGSKRLKTLYSVMFWLVLVGILSQLKLSGFNASYYPEHVACVDQAVEDAGAVNLVGDYWVARHYSFVSDKLNVDPFRDDFKRESKVNNPDRFVNTYSGFLVDSIDGRGFTKAQIKKQFGPAQKEIACSKVKVLIYNSNSIIVNENNRLVRL